MLKDNFYKYVNKKWIKNNPIPDNYTRWGTFEILHEQNLKRLKKIMTKKYNNNNNNNNKFKKINTLYKEFMNTKKINKLKLKPVKKYIDIINNCKTKNELWLELSKLNNYGFSFMSSIFVEVDAKNTNVNRMYMMSSGLGLLGRSYYFDKDKNNIRKKYIKYINDISNTNLGKKIFNIEIELAKSTYTSIKKRDPELNYNKITLKKLSKLTNLDWISYFKNITKKNIPFIIIDNPNFYKKMGTIWEKTDLYLLQQFFIYKFISQFASYLNDKISNIKFNFYNKFLNGQKIKNDRWKKAVGAISIMVGELVGELYIKNYFSLKAKKKVENMIKQMNITLKNRIKNLDWMGKKTKEKALKKNKSFKAYIGYPSSWYDYSDFNFNKENLIEMILESNFKSYQNDLNDLNKKSKTDMWEMNVFDINAYFNPLKNEIVFPAGILQDPFFDINNDDIKNYSGIGEVIGHEMIHSYDDQGSQFDWNGNINNWWTTKDLKLFNKKTKYFIKEYNKFKFFNVNVNGKLTLGENIADIGGINIAYKTLLKLNKNLTNNDKKKFFIHYAKIYKNNIKKKKLINQILTDPHSPGEARVNGSLSNNKEFHQLFNIKKGDKMFRDKIPDLW